MRLLTEFSTPPTMLRIDFGLSRWTCGPRGDASADHPGLTSIRVVAHPGDDRMGACSSSLPSDLLGIDLAAMFQGLANKAGGERDAMADDVIDIEDT